MIFSIESIIESIVNPQGRFRTLNGIYPIIDSNNKPKMVTNRVFTEIFVKLNGKDYKIQIPLHANGAMCRRAQRLSDYLSKVNTPYITDYKFIESEMVVFAKDGNSMFCDIILIETAKSRSLNSILTEMCDNNKIKHINDLIIEFRNMVKWMLDSGISHERLNPRYIKVDNDGKMEMCGYHHIDTNPENITLGFSEILSTTIYMKMLLSKPEACHTFDRSGVPNIISLLPSVDRNITEALSSTSSLIKALDKLISVDNISHSDILCSIMEQSYTAQPYDILPKREAIHFDSMEPLAENMQCVELNGKFGFTDADGNIAIELKYDAASSFKEGRAVVVVDNNFGMIDKTGREILRMIYESVDWYPEEDVAKIVMDGKSGLVDRNAEIIVPLIYDWMGEISNGPICVKKDDRYGYIDYTGNVCIDIMFEDASGFNNGLAQITKDNNKLYINTNGIIVSEPV